jgi:hypothetical protein
MLPIPTRTLGSFCGIVSTLLGEIQEGLTSFPGRILLYGGGCTSHWHWHGVRVREPVVDLQVANGRLVSTTLATRLRNSPPIMKTKRDVYVGMRARIALRKANIPLQVEKVEEEVKNIKNDRGRHITVEDIISAFERGEEVSVLIVLLFRRFDRFPIRPSILSKWNASLTIVYS